MEYMDTNGMNIERKGEIDLVEKTNRYGRVYFQGIREPYVPHVSRAQMNLNPSFILRIVHKSVHPQSVEEQIVPSRYKKTKSLSNILS